MVQLKNIHSRQLLSILCFLGIALSMLTHARGDASHASRFTSVEQARLLEKKTVDLNDQLAKTTVALRVGSSQGSGVIISPDGLVLTAAHVSGEAGKPVTVILNDGRQVQGKTLGAYRSVDAGMIQITSNPPGRDKAFAHVDVDKAEKPELGEWVVAVGHPEGYEKERGTVTRLGRVIAAEDEFLWTDAALIAGDSGGPLFNLEGKLVGIHSRIGEDAYDNYHVPISQFTRHMERLKKGEVWGSWAGLQANRAFLGIGGSDGDKGVEVTQVMPNSAAAKAGVRQGDVIIALDRLPVRNMAGVFGVLQRKNPGDRVVVRLLREGRPVTLIANLGTRSQLGIDEQSKAPRIIERLRQAQWTRGYDNLKVFQSAAKDVQEAVVRIEADGDMVQYGTVIDRSGYIVTKANPLTEAKALKVRLRTGQTLPATVIKRENDHDLLLLKVDVGDGKLQAAKLAKEESRPGQWVVTVDTDFIPVATVGVIGTAEREIAPEPGTLGILIGQTEEDGVAISEVFKKTAAEEVGLKSGDVVTHIAGRKIQHPADLVRNIQKHQVGETLVIQIRRGEEKLTVMPKLGRRVDGMGLSRNDRMNLMTGQLSLRAAGFPKVIQHDGIVRPDQVGTPLVNLDGQMVGLNIARAGRIETYAIPVSVIQDLLKSVDE